jgi:hypothetical protein
LNASHGTHTFSPGMQCLAWAKQRMYHGEDDVVLQWCRDRSCRSCAVHNVKILIDREDEVATRLQGLVKLVNQRVYYTCLLTSLFWISYFAIKPLTNLCNTDKCPLGDYALVFCILGFFFFAIVFPLSFFFPKRLLPPRVVPHLPNYDHIMVNIVNFTSTDTRVRRVRDPTVTTTSMVNRLQGTPVQDLPAVPNQDRMPTAILSERVVSAA